MACKVTTVPFRGTKEQEEKLLAVIDELRDTPGALMPIMQRAQDIYGYLPIEVQTIIADQMNVPLEKIYGIATFYAQFALAPKGEYRIAVCLGTACYVKGAQAVFDVSSPACRRASAPPTASSLWRPAAAWAPAASPPS